MATDARPKRLAAMLTRLEHAFARGAWWKLSALVLVLLGHVLAQGVQLDDYWQLVSLSHDPRWVPMHRPPWAIFTFFDGSVVQGRWSRALGVSAWWSSTAVKLDFWRPLSSLTHAADFALCRGCAWLMHLHSLLWYVAVVLAAAALYRRILDAREATVATLLYTLDPAHAGVAAWNANRNALLATCFGLLGVLQFDRGAREGRRDAIVLAPVCFGLALLSGESAVGALALLAAYVFVLDPRPWRTRALALAPIALVALAWSAAYRLGGHGVEHTGMYLDPIADPLRFAREVPRNAMLLLASVWSYVLPEMAIVAPNAVPFMFAFAALSVLAALVALGPTLRTDPRVRFLVLGGVLALAPSCATIPNGRLLLLPGFGLLGALATQVVRFADAGLETPRGVRVARAWFGGAVGVGRMVLGVVFVPIMAWQVVMLDAAFLRCSQSIARDDRDLPAQRLIVVNAPDAAFAGYFIVHRQALGWTWPRALLALAVGTRDVTLQRVDADTIEVHSQNGFYRGITDALMRDPHDPLPVGTDVDLGDVSVRVTHATPDGMPDAARFRFMGGVDGARYRWVQWDGRRYRPFIPPTIGAGVALAAIPLRP